MKTILSLCLLIFLSACTQSISSSKKQAFDPAKPYTISGPLTEAEQQAIFPRCVQEKDHSPVLTAAQLADFKRLRTRESNPYYRDPQEEAAITAEYERQAATGNWKAQFNLAFRYINGKGSPRNTRKGLDILQPMAEANIPIGIYGMAVMIQKGWGVKSNHTLASQYMYRAAELGSPLAQLYLGSQAYVRYQTILGRNYLTCAAEQGNAEAGYQAGGWISTGEENYPQAAYYYWLAASNGHPIAFTALDDYFGNDRYTEYGFDANPKFMQCIKKYERILDDEDPSAKFPEMRDKCPLPLHPIMGDGSQYPIASFRLSGFLERIKSGSYDPDWEKREGDKRNWEDQKAYWQRRRSASVAPEPLKTIPLKDADSWAASEIQKGEYLIKRDQQWIYVKDGREVPSNIQGYLASIFDTFNQPIINLAEFHENTSGKYQNMLKSQLT